MSECWTAEKEVPSGSGTALGQGIDSGYRQTGGAEGRGRGTVYARLALSAVCIEGGSGCGWNYMPVRR